MHFILYDGISRNNVTSSIVPYKLLYMGSNKYYITDCITFKKCVIHDFLWVIMDWQCQLLLGKNMPALCWQPVVLHLGKNVFKSKCMNVSLSAILCFRSCNSRNTLFIDFHKTKTADWKAFTNCYYGSRPPQMLLTCICIWLVNAFFTPFKLYTNKEAPKP